MTIRRLWEELKSFEAIYYIEETEQEANLPALRRVMRRIGETRKDQKRCWSSIIVFCGGNTVYYPV